MTSTLHLVVPGQVIASTASSASLEEDSFLRGHGTYLEHLENPQTSQPEQRLVASVCGTVQRVNKLITVVPASASIYHGQVGDLVVGRIVAVGATRWKVQLVSNGGRDAQLPLSGIHLPGGVQRIRTAQDQRDMRQFFVEGDLVSAEVHKVQQDGTLLLHTRSTRYGKLENGVLVAGIPPALMARRKNHYLTDFLDHMDVVWGTNGNVWIQRRLNRNRNQPGSATAEDGGSTNAGSNNNNPLEDLNEVHEKLRQEHSAAPLLKEDRIRLARLRNSMECLRMVHTMMTPEAVAQVYTMSLQESIRPADMLRPETVLHLTASTRNHS